VDTMNYIHNVEYLEQVVPVRYVLDTEFFDFNPEEIWARVEHYRGDDVYPWHQYVYTPSLRFNGGYYGDPSDDSMYVFNTYDDWYARVRHVIDSLLAVPSPIRVDLLENYQDVDSVYLTFDIVAEDVIPDTLRLYVAATESLYRYPFPTGKWWHAFRDFAVDSGGYDLTMTMGDSVRYTWSWPIDPVYRIDRLVSNIWIEDPETQEVLQALRDFVPEVLSGIEVADIPDMRLHRNTPNPFSSKTSISYSMTAAGKVHLAVYSLDGRLVRQLEDAYLEPGLHKTDWDGRDRHGNEVASGVYYYRIATEQASHAGKMIVLR
jgi:hypothetical protein